MNKVWKVKRMWVGGDGIVNGVEFELVFSDATKPGVESIHGGIVDVSFAKLSSSATEAQLIDALELRFNAEMEALQATHAAQLAFLYDQATSTPVQVAPITVTEQDVINERERRLSAGFDYVFANGGKHRVGTTEQDLKGWDEVTKVAQAAINLGNPGMVINIVTDDGPVATNPMEWQQVLFSAAAFRQPIFAASFRLQAMNPIPTDYKDAKHWP